MANPTISLKLLVDKQGKRVLFGEASKNFVDFLLHIFSLPMGTLIEFLGSKQMVGCLGKLKESVERLNQTYLQPGIDKDDIFNPKTAFDGDVLTLSYDYHAPADDQSKTLYRCSNTFQQCYSCNSHSACRLYATEYVDARCPSCRGSMNVPLTSVVPDDAAAAKRAAEEAVKLKKRKVMGGYVKEVVTYMVMDDLVVAPMSTISSITLINKFDVKDLSQLQFLLGKMRL